MPRNIQPSRKPLAVLPRRNLPSSLLKKRCEARFAQVIQEYGDSEGHAVEWALISESGRANKVLLVSVYGKQEFPMQWINKKLAPVSVRQSDDEDELESDEGGEKGQSDGEDETLSKGKGGKLNKEDEKTLGSDAVEKSQGGDGGMSQEDDGIKLEGSGDESDLEDPIFTMTENYQIKGDSSEDDSPGVAHKKRKEYQETYTIVGTIMDGEVQWLCDLPQYPEFEDKTTYFSKDGLSMVHGVRFQDNIKDRELAALAELEKVRAKEQEAFLAEQKAKKVAKKARQKAKEKAPEHSDVEDDASAKKGEKARAKRARQKQKRELAKEAEAEEEKAVEEAAEANAKALFEQHVGERLRPGDGKNRVIVVDANTPEGAAAIEKYSKEGAKILPIG